MKQTVRALALLVAILFFSAPVLAVTKQPAGKRTACEEKRQECIAKHAVTRDSGDKLVTPEYARKCWTVFRECIKDAR